MGRYYLEIYGKLHGVWELSKDWVKKGYINVCRADQGYIAYLYGVREEILRDPNPILVLPDVRPRTMLIGEAEEWARQRGIKIEWVPPSPPALGWDKKEVIFNIRHLGYRVVALPGEWARYHKMVAPLDYWQVEFTRPWRSDPRGWQAEIHYVTADGLEVAKKLRNPIRLALARIGWAIDDWRREWKRRRKRKKERKKGG